MQATWLRLLAAATAVAVSIVAGLAALGTFDREPDPVTGIPAGANGFMLVLALALVLGFVAYAAVEWAQTRRLESIARQFDTRTIVLIPVAIAINIALGQTVGVALKLPVYLDSVGTILVGVLAGPFAGAATGLFSNLAWTFLLAGTPFGSPYAWPFAIVAIEVGLVAGLFGYAGVFRRRPNTPPRQLVAGLVAALAVLGGLVWFGVLPFYRNACLEEATQAEYCLELLRDGSGAPLSFAFSAVGAAIAVGFVLTLVVVILRLLRDRDIGLAYVLVAGVACGVLSAFIAAPIAALVFGGVTGSGTDLLVAAFLFAGSDLQTAVLQQSLISDSVDKAVSFLIVFALVGGLSRRVAARFPQGERAIGTVED